MQLQGGGPRGSVLACLQKRFFVNSCASALVSPTATTQVLWFLLKRYKNFVTNFRRNICPRPRMELRCFTPGRKRRCNAPVQILNCGSVPSLINFWFISWLRSCHDKNSSLVAHRTPTPIKISSLSWLDFWVLLAVSPPWPNTLPWYPPWPKSCILQDSVPPWPSIFPWYPPWPSILPWFPPWPKSCIPQDSVPTWPNIFPWFHPTLTFIRGPPSLCNLFAQSCHWGHATPFTRRKQLLKQQIQAQTQNARDTHVETHDKCQTLFFLLLILY